MLPEIISGQMASPIHADIAENEGSWTLFRVREKANRSARRPFIRSMPIFSMRKRNRSNPADSASAAGEAHHCGLRHVHSCGNWSIMAAILWWALRTPK